MQLLEFQAKELLARFGIEVPRGRICGSAAEAGTTARPLGFERFAVKPQIRAGDRRAAGGIRFAASPDGVKATAEPMIGKPLVTLQTGPTGETVRWVLVEEALQPVKLMFAAVALDRDAGTLKLIVSQEGGEGIEVMAAAAPGIVHTADVQPDGGKPECDIAGLVEALGLPNEMAGAVGTALERLVGAAVALDCTLLEVNPLAVLPSGQVVALDAKMTIDDNALVRHPGLAALRSATQVEDGDPEELAADRHHLNYQRMTGNVGVVANGAGLALATLDMVRDAGGNPANFMDIRTTASSLDVAYGFDLLLSNPAVAAVLVNVHGGGMQRCDTIAEGVGIAMRRNPRSVPLIVRMAGNNADFARVRLDSYGVGYSEAAGMREAVTSAVAAAAAASEAGKGRAPARDRGP